MEKRVFLLNNITNKPIRITEFNLLLPIGISNLFELKPELTHEQIDFCMKKGSLRKLIENRIIYSIQDISLQKSFSSDIIIRHQLPLQIFPSRVKFSNELTMSSTTTNVFDPEEEADLFQDEDVMPARQLEEEIKKSVENTQIVEATIKDANLPEKPIENKFIPISLQLNQNELRQKIKNDIIMGYQTCNGINLNGTKCLRRAKTDQHFCGLHKHQDIEKKDV